MITLMVLSSIMNSEVSVQFGQIILSIFQNSMSFVPFRKANVSYMEYLKSLHVQSAHFSLLQRQRMEALLCVESGNALWY